MEPADQVTTPSMTTSLRPLDLAIPEAGTCLDFLVTSQQFSYLFESSRMEFPFSALAKRESPNK